MVEVARGGEGEGARTVGEWGVVAKRERGVKGSRERRRRRAGGRA